MALSSDDTRLSRSPSGGWPQPRSAYIHVPFCRHRCGYCNFSVIADRDDLIERYLVAIDLELSLLNRPKVETLFVGGGTPTHLNDDQLDRLLTLITQRFDWDSDGEWSIEANPEDITTEKLDLLAAHGVNRISLGLQSLDDNKLRMLERGHTGRSAEAAVEWVASRIGNVSIDLIFAAPGETLEAWNRDLEKALSLPVRHLSTYALTFEKGTSFWSRRKRGDLESLSESDEVEMYRSARQSAAGAGLRHYEVSNFAAPGFECRHNLSYWDGQGWYAAGPGAARFVDGRREVNHRSTSTYLRRIETRQDPTAESEPISIEQYARERAAFGIRMIDGVDMNAIGQSSGVELQELCREAIETSVQEGLVQTTGDRVQLTERGILFADTVASRLLG